ncbi:MAG: tryptophan-rich sensory protein [Chloroflexi bacterium]|nr:MAG: tryptophan-rich sensory protein [Chloroflexota bacterium]
MPITRRDAAALGLSILLPNLGGAIGAWFTSNSVNGWYRTLDKPEWNPPPWIFGPVWTALYALMGTAAWLVYRADRTPSGAPASNDTKRALAIYAAQLGLNAAWSPIFFGARRIDLALAVILSMLVAITATIRSFYRVRPLAAALLLPYLAWTTFATALNTALYLKNR